MISSEIRKEKKCQILPILFIILLKMLTYILCIQKIQEPALPRLYGYLHAGASIAPSKDHFVPLSGWQLLANTVFNKTSRFDGYVATIVGNILATYCSYRKVNSMSLIQWIDTMFCRVLRWTRSLWIILQLNMGELTYSWVKIIPLSISRACKLLLILSEKNGKEYLPDHWSSSTKYLKLC